MNRKPVALLALALLLPACTPEPTATGESPVPLAAAVKSRGVSTNSGITTIDLGILPGGGSSRANAINQQGTIAGVGDDASGVNHLVRWKRGGTIEDLGSFLGTSTTGLAIDDAEEIVGDYAAPGASGHAFYWNQATGFQALPEGGLGTSEAHGVARINNGTVTRIVGCAGGKIAHWNRDIFGNITLVVPGSIDGCANAVSYKGDYVGLTGPFPPCNFSGAFLYTAGTLVNIKLLPNPCGHNPFSLAGGPYRIVGGNLNGSSNSYLDALLWPTPTSLPIVLSKSSAVAYGINRATEVVGSSNNFFLPFYWNSNVGILQLPGLGSALGDGEALALNDSAEVVGYASLAGGASHATLWLPHDTAQVIIVKQLPFDTTTHLPPKVSYIPKGFINDGILSRPGFDATQLDPNFITLGDGTGHVTAIARSATGAPKAVPQDVNGDGVLDLKVSFSKAQLITDGVLTRTSYQFEITYVEVTGLQVKAHYPIWVK